MSNDAITNREQVIRKMATQCESAMNLLKDGKQILAYNKLVSIRDMTLHLLSEEVTSKDNGNKSAN